MSALSDALGFGGISKAIRVNVEDPLYLHGLPGYKEGLAATAEAGAAILGGNAALGATGAATGSAATGAGASAGTASTVNPLIGQIGASLLPTVVSGLLGKKDMQEAPTVQPVTPMPDPEAQAEARRRSLIEQTARRGRASTIMTSPNSGSGRLGG